MTFLPRLTTLACAVALAVTVGCGNAVTGSPELGSTVPEEAASAAQSDDPSEDPDEGDTDEGDTDQVDSAADDSERDGAANATEPTSEDTSSADTSDSDDTALDPATAAWFDASCRDIMVVMDVLFNFPDLAPDASSDDYVIANIDYYDAIGTAVAELAEEAQTRTAPGLADGELVHDAYLAQLTALGEAAAQGALDLELLRRSGSADDLAAAIERVQSEVDALAASDFGGIGVDEEAFDAAFAIATSTVPSCQELN